MLLKHTRVCATDVYVLVSWLNKFTFNLHTNEMNPQGVIKIILSFPLTICFHHLVNIK